MKKENDQLIQLTAIPGSLNILLMHFNYHQEFILSGMNPYQREIIKTFFNIRNGFDEIIFNRIKINGLSSETVKLFVSMGLSLQNVRKSFSYTKWANAQVQ